MRAAALTVLAAISVVAGGAWAGLHDLPRVERSTLNGTWQAVVPDEPRLFVLQIEAAGASVAAMALNVAPRTVAFRLTRVEVQKGRVRIEGRSPDGERLQVTGTGYVLEGEGRIEATVALFPPNPKYGPTEWTVNFDMRHGGHLETLFQMLKASEEAMKALAPPLPPPKGP